MPPRTEFHTDPAPRPGVLKALAHDARRLPPGSQVLLCFTCDPYQPLEREYHLTRQAIGILHSAGHSVNVLTKSASALDDLLLFGRGDAFGVTLTTLSPYDSAEWESGADNAVARIYALEQFHSDGVTTWVSLEPVLDVADALTLVRLTHEFTDHYKIGRINHVENLPPAFRARVANIDWRTFAQAVTRQLDGYGFRRCHEPGVIPLGASYYLKRGLLRAAGME